MTRDELNTLVRYVEKHSKRIAKIVVSEEPITSAFELCIVPRYKNLANEALQEGKQWFGRECNVVVRAEQ